MKHRRLTTTLLLLSILLIVAVLIRATIIKHSIKEMYTESSGGIAIVDGSTAINYIRTSLFDSSSSSGKEGERNKKGKGNNNQYDMSDATLSYLTNGKGYTTNTSLFNTSSGKDTNNPNNQNNKKVSVNSASLSSCPKCPKCPPQYVIEENELDNYKTDIDKRVLIEREILEEQKRQLNADISESEQILNSRINDLNELGYIEYDLSDLQRTNVIGNLSIEALRNSLLPIQESVEAVQADIASVNSKLDQYNEQQAKEEQPPKKKKRKKILGIF